MIKLKQESETKKGFWFFTEAEILKIQNRMNDLWDTPPSDIDEYIAVANRLLGCLDTLINFDHYATSEER